MKSIKTTFTRVKQVAQEQLFDAERTELDTDLKTRFAKLEGVKKHAHTLVTDVEAMLQPDPALRLLTGVLVQDDKANKQEAVGIEMADLGASVGKTTPLGETLGKASEAYKELGRVEREHITQMQTVFCRPVKAYLDGTMKDFEHEKKELENRRIDMDHYKVKPETHKPDKAERANEDYQKQLTKTEAAVEKAEEGLTELQRNVRCLLEAHVRYCDQQKEILTEMTQKL